MEDVILYGAGSDLDKIFSMLEIQGYNPLCVADGNREKVGMKIYGIPIVEPKDILSYKSKKIIITASFFDSIYKRIESLLDERIDEYTVLVAPYAWLMLVNVTYDSLLLNDASKYIENKKNEILKIYDLTDLKTKMILEFITNARISKKFSFNDYSEMHGLQYVEGYFYENELKDYREITFLDIGAYIGDTYESMVKMYKKQIKRYYAYEPSSENYKKLLEIIPGNEYDSFTTCKNVALGDVNGQINMGKSGGEFGILDEIQKTKTELVTVAKLDDENIHVDGSLVIKMDVEGAEMSILKGGVKTILKYHPIMAICVYHKYRDIYELPKFIKDMGLNYRFVLRSGIHTHLIAFPQD